MGMESELLKNWIVKPVIRHSENTIHFELSKKVYSAHNVIRANSDDGQIGAQVWESKQSTVDSIVLSD